MPSDKNKPELEPRVFLLSVPPESLVKDFEIKDYKDVTPLLFETDENGLLKKDKEGNYKPTKNKLVVEESKKELENGESTSIYKAKIINENEKDILVFDSELKLDNAVAVIKMPVKDNKIDYSHMAEPQNKQNPNKVLEISNITTMGDEVERYKTMAGSTTTYGRAEFVFHPEKDFDPGVDIKFLDDNKFEQKEKNWFHHCSCDMQCEPITLSEELLKMAGSNRLQGALVKGSVEFTALDKIAKDSDLNLNSAEAKELIRQAQKILSDDMIGQQEKNEFTAVISKLGVSDRGIHLDGKKKTGWVVE